MDLIEILRFFTLTFQERSYKIGKNNCVGRKFFFITYYMYYMSVSFFFLRPFIIHNYEAVSRQCAIKRIFSNLAPLAGRNTLKFFLIDIWPAVLVWAHNRRAHLHLHIHTHVLKTCFCVLSQCFNQQSAQWWNWNTIYDLLLHHYI